MGVPFDIVDNARVCRRRGCWIKVIARGSTLVHSVNPRLSYGGAVDYARSDWAELLQLVCFLFDLHNAVLFAFAKSIVFLGSPVACMQYMQSVLHLASSGISSTNQLEPEPTPPISHAVSQTMCHLL
ncbi:hypothetical protein MRB53_040157 [Persea americana]|nr:hypothetical protein MRB53_040157 [Persea americana]